MANFSFIDCKNLFILEENINPLKTSYKRLIQEEQRQRKKDAKACSLKALIDSKKIKR